MIHLGIAPGSYASSIAHINHAGLPTLIPDYYDAKELRTPSKAAFAVDCVYVGQAAAAAVYRNPALNMIQFRKDRLGGHPRRIEPKGYTDEEVLAVVIRKLMRDAQGVVGSQDPAVVITVPAHADDKRRRAYLRAARLAGLTRIQLEEEAFAVALHYGFGSVSTSKLLLVYNFGAENFEVALIKSDPEGVQIMCAGAMDGLGTGRLSDKMVETVSERLSGSRQVEAVQNDHDQAAVYAEEILGEFSTQGAERSRRTILFSGDLVETLVTRRLYRALVEPLIRETITLSKRCIEEAGLGPPDYALMAGGGAAIPLVPVMLAQELGLTQDRIILKRPEFAPAFGAALCSSRMGNNAHAATFLRTTTADLGIRIRDAHTGKPSFQTLIKKGTPLPANARTKVYTTGSHQTKVMLDIIEAGRLGLPSKSIAAYAFGPIDQPQPDTPVEIRFRVDRSGLIDANARHALSGKELPRLQRREDSVRGPSSAFPVHLTLI